MAAVHEAGHAVIATSLGIPVASVAIWTNEGNEAAADRWEKSWVGQTQLRYYKAIGLDKTLAAAEASIFSVRNIKATKKQNRMIGVAGIVAEAIWLGDDPCEIDPTETSASDLEMIGRCSLSQFASAIDQVAALLKRDTGVL